MLGIAAAGRRAKVNAMGWVLFFDGDCAFCSDAVRRVARFDARGRVDFAPLQGKLAGEMDLTANAAKSGGTMVLLREADGVLFTRSDALIELARALGGFWQVLTLSRFIPKPLRDWVYNRIADNRDRLIRKGTTCALPTPELRSRLRE